MRVNKSDRSIVRLEEGIFLIPGRSGGGCNVFVLKGTRKNLLIDVGLSSDYEILCHSLGEIGLTINDIHLVVLTHEHVDHVGCLECLPAHIVVAAHGRAANKLMLDDQFAMMKGAFKEIEKTSSHIDIRLEDGALIDLGGIRLRVIYTPGHCSGAICLHELKTGALFSGDTLFANGILGGILASGNISDYISSLERLQELKLVSLYPGHGHMSNTPVSDLERAISGSSLLMKDTQSLFGCIDIHGSFEHILLATQDYSRQAAERRTNSRVPCDIEALVHLTDESHPVKVQDISISGVKLDREIHLHEEDKISISIKEIGTIECKLVIPRNGHTHFTFLHSSVELSSLESWLTEARQHKSNHH